MTGVPNTFSIIPKPLDQKLLEASKQIGGPEKWGLTSGFKGVWLEPYSYATALVAECLSTIDAIAFATDVSRLFPDRHPIPWLIEVAPKDANSIFRWAERIALLG